MGAMYVSVPIEGLISCGTLAKDATEPLAIREEEEVCERGV